MAISEQWAELLAPGLKAIFNLQVDALAATAKAPLFFNVQGSTRANEYALNVGGFGDWKEYKGAIEYDDFDQGYKTTFTHVEYARGFKVERKLVDDDLYSIINARPAGLALSAMRKREKDAADIFNNAFASGLGADSQYLCDDAHPASPANTATTQDNAGSSALSRDAIIETRRLMREFKDDRGELIQVMPDILLVPPELEDEAVVYTASTQKPGSADNDVNFANRLGLQVVVWDYLTDATNWFMIDSRLAKQHLWWFNRVPTEFDLDPQSNYLLEAKFRGYARYSLGFSDWRWCYGHSV
jgi:phage major head subunit gpT-like protein